MNETWSICNDMKASSCPLDMMQKCSWSILDQRFLYEKYESEFEEGEGEGALDPQEDLFKGKSYKYAILKKYLPSMSI
ncbi:hypothetical protein H5410_005487 [Solanum commersonii]|uniref:Uncharacterized protein n=1 Tax=Solanum commersonii TaxID=4109 RepID=A0A9J6A6R2_SOLCO|nr:hypothetical protein H5410_005487 [Solanum commersonii]